MFIKVEGNRGDFPWPVSQWKRPVLMRDQIRHNWELLVTFNDMEVKGDLSKNSFAIHPKETKIEKDTCIPLFTAELFTIARTRKQPRCPLTDEWIKKLWYTYTIEYYSAIKMNAFESVLMRWTNLKPIIQSEANQKEKDKYCILTYIYRI